MSMTVATPRVLGDAVPGGLTRDVALVGAGAVLTGIAAQIALPLPFTPIPLTMQTLAVLLVAASLGTKRGLASMLLYVGVGAAGVPWFTNGTSGFTASFGYAVGFLLAALLVGRLAEQGGTRRPLNTAGVMIAGNLAIYAVGVPWLMFAANIGLGKALALGVLPFLVGDLIKVAVAAGAMPSAWKLSDKH
ncbi:MAG: biotin transporter BioY [Allobranchiibius sp.]